MSTESAEQPTTTPPAEDVRRPYERPELVRYGHVKDLTTGAKPGVGDIPINTSIG
jgi:hypothetical protein